MTAMRYAIDVCPLGDLSDPATIVRLAVAAEAAGWDGLSIWDSLGTSMGTTAADPFIALAAVATATSRLRLITSVLALSRRRPQLVAQSAASLDRLSGGRLVLGLGSGGDPGDFEPFGDPFEARERARALDTGAALIDSYLSEGRLGPRSPQHPRPPIWIGGMSDAALRRAARWDGWIAIAVSEDGSRISLSPNQLGAMVDRIRAQRRTLGSADKNFDTAVFAFSEPDEIDLAAGFAAAGATWWLESLSPLRGSIDLLLRRVDAGPPQIGAHHGVANYPQFVHTRPSSN